jgi:hypothetical protein
VRELRRLQECRIVDFAASFVYRMRAGSAGSRGANFSHMTIDPTKRDTEKHFRRPAKLEETHGFQ